MNLSDQFEDLVQNNLDLAIRIGDLPDSSLIATRISETRLVYCASQSFLDQGEILKPIDLENKKRVVVSSLRSDWTFVDQGEKIILTNKPILLTDQISVARRACIDGLGVGCFYYYQVAKAIESQQLNIILNDFNRDLIPIHFVYPHVKLISPRVKHFMSWFKDKIIKLKFY